MSFILNFTSRSFARAAFVLVIVACAVSCARFAKNNSQLYSYMLEVHEHAMFDYFRDDYKSAIGYFDEYLDVYATLNRRNISQLDYMDHENAVLASCRLVVILHKLQRHRDIQKQLDGTLKALRNLMVTEQAEGIAPKTLHDLVSFVNDQDDCIRFTWQWAIDSDEWGGGVSKGERVPHSSNWEAD